MKKSSDKGFTLVEVIIAIAILSIVISIGYSVINKSSAFTRENQITYNGQQSIKLVNQYLTKDIDQAKSILRIDGEPSNSIGEYGITLETSDGNNPKYLVKIYEDKNKKYYDVTREVGSEKLDLVTKQPIDKNSDEIPFNIVQNNNSYDVSLYYKDKNISKVYEFQVTSRIKNVILAVNPEPEQPNPDPNPNPETTPEIDDLLNGNGFIRFKYEDNKVSTEIGSSKTTNGKYTTYDKSDMESTEDVFNFSTELGFNNNNGKCSSSIGANNKNASANTMQKQDFGQMTVNQINVTLVGDIKLDLKIEEDKSIKYNQTLLQPGKQGFPISSGKKIIISGTMTKTNDKSYGEAIITFGAKK